MKTHCVFCEVVTVLWYADVPRSFQAHNFRNVILRKVKQKKIAIKFVDIVLKFSWLKWKGKERGVAEEYCWATTQATGRSGYSPSTLRVLWSRIAPGLPSSVYTGPPHIHVINCYLVPGLPEHYCVNLGSVYCADWLVKIPPVYCACCWHSHSSCVQAT
jgi:hypothetical protein